MSASYLVRYEGTSTDRNAFLCHYREEHVPILARMPGVERIVLHTQFEAGDPFPTQTTDTLLIAEMVFASSQDLKAALQSTTRAEAREQFATFTGFHGRVIHHAVESEEVFRG